MSSYIPPIESSKSCALHVRRYDPDRDATSRWETFQIPWVPTMTVMQALEWLCDQGKYVAFRANCREFTCGSCTMLIDGKPGLACDTLLRDGTRLEPLHRYPVKRDLVVDTSAVIETWRRLELWPRQDSSQAPPAVQAVPKPILERWHRSYARCMECYACLDACPASESDSSSFAGPMWMLQIGRAGAHPVDRADRSRQAIDEGIGLCVSCYECADVCPVSISPIAEIQRLRREILLERFKRWAMKLGLGTVSASLEAKQKESS